MMRQLICPLPTSADSPLHLRMIHLRFLYSWMNHCRMNCITLLPDGSCQFLGVALVPLPLSSFQAEAGVPVFPHNPPPPSCLQECRVAYPTSPAACGSASPSQTLSFLEPEPLLLMMPVAASICHHSSSLPHLAAPSSAD